MFKNPDDVKRSRPQHLHIVGGLDRTDRVESHSVEALPKQCFKIPRREQKQGTTQLVPAGRLWRICYNTVFYGCCRISSHSCTLGKSLTNIITAGLLGYFSSALTLNQFNSISITLSICLLISKEKLSAAIQHNSLCTQFGPNVHSLMMQLSPPAVSIAITCLSLVCCRLQQHIRIQLRLPLLPSA